MLYDYLLVGYFNKVRPFLGNFLRWGVECNLPMNGTWWGGVKMVWAI